MNSSAFKYLGATVLCVALSAPAFTNETQHGHAVEDSVIAEQTKMLLEFIEGKGFGPQSPRDIESSHGENNRAFGEAPAYSEMNLCNIHFHENAEHKGGEFTTYAGNGDGEGNGTGFKYNGHLTDAELAPFEGEVGVSEHGSLEPGDTIEVHFVHSTAQVAPGATLGACLNENIGNPQLRVETQVFVLVNDPAAADFVALTEIGDIDGYAQAVNLPADNGDAVEYDGSTTGPKYNETGSPFQVTWNVRKSVIKLNIATVDAWLQGNVFEENHAHGVRNLVTDPALLSEITN